MAVFHDLFCSKEPRRSQAINGIDYIEVSADTLDAQRFINVYFLKDLPPQGLENSKELFHIEGGVRIRDIRVLGVTKIDSHLRVEVDKAGDFSTYTLVINSQLLDPVYSQCDFSFKAGCPSRFDCKPRKICPVETGPRPDIDYMAKDYASFRQALIDLIPTLVPDWKERHEADLGITLLELLAYAGDQLSYYQDAAANEAYLKTARQRISVRRHVSLIDYHMHDGVSARAFVHFRVASKGQIPKGTQVLTEIDVPLAGTSSPPGPVIPAGMKELAVAATDTVFETIDDLAVSDTLNDIQIYVWFNNNQNKNGFNQKCCLPRGTTTVDLLGNLTEDLHIGDLLLFEEVVDPDTGMTAGADSNHKQVVRLTDVKLTHDPIVTPPPDITRVNWDKKDALTFPLCIFSYHEDGSPIENVSLARGNITVADHGRRIEEESHLGPERPKYPSQSRPHRIFLNEGPLSFRLEPDSKGPAADLQMTDPHQAKPQILDLTVDSIPDWKPAVLNLMNSGPFDRHFAVETDNEGRAMIRFGDGEYGMEPPDYDPGSNETFINVTYRVGVGTAGNVGPESLIHIIEPEVKDNWPEIDIASSVQKPVRNPLPAFGGIEPESIEKVKQIAPAAFHAEQFRAVTEEDYALVAEKYPGVSKAVATFRWTGSWLTVFVTVDPSGSTELTPELKLKVKNWISRFTQAGYDLEINGPIYVPLEIEVEICVDPYHFRGDVEKEVITILSNRILPDGQPGFFYPDNFTFGQSIYLSQIYAAIDAVEGVRSSNITVFKKFGKTAYNELKKGYISMGRLEVARLDNDLNFPENGALRLIMKGGK